MLPASVLVGVPDISVNTPTTWEVNKIGGNPDLLLDFPVVNCIKCTRAMVHAMQIYCPLESSPFHRVLQIFVCTSKSCWNNDYSWKVYRTQLRDKSTVKNISSSIQANDEPKVSMETSSWCDGADDWGDDDDDDDPVAMVSSSQADGKFDPRLMVSCDNHDTVSMIASSGDVDNSDWVAMVSSSQGDDSPDLVDMVTSGQIKSEAQRTEVFNSDESFIAGMDELDVNGDGTSVIEEEDVVIFPSKDSVQNVLSCLSINTSPSDKLTDCIVEDSIPLESYYLNVFEEPACEYSGEKHAMKLLAEYERKERVDVSDLADRDDRGGRKSDGEKYEKAQIRHGDKCFHKFIKTLKRCPEQVVRYHYGGVPLLMRNLPPGCMPMNCPTCREPRQFELQLLPPLIPCLHHASPQSGPVVEFGTVLVYTCSQSCWDEVHPTPREEFVIVQADPDQHLFKS